MASAASQGREAAIAAIDDPDVHYSDAVEIMLALGLDRRPDPFATIFANQINNIQ